MTPRHRTYRRLVLAALACVALGSCSKLEDSKYPLFKTPEEAVHALSAAVTKHDVDAVTAIFGPDGPALIDVSDPAAARRSRDVFAAAIAEGWRLVDEGDHKILVVGNEAWPFPIPLVKNAFGWRFDTAAGREEVLARRIGRNELVAIRVCRTYVAAQRLYARQGHDGKPAGLYATTVRSDPGRQNGLYWAAARGQKRSPLGDLLAEAAEARRGRTDRSPSPFYGYYFRILTAQGPAAPGGSKDYVVNGDMSGGFALIAWPAEYDVTGVMTFLVNEDGIVFQKDLGKTTGLEAARIMRYDPDASWSPAD